jgi:hypothetical protein
MASQKIVKFALAGALIAVALSVVGYVMVFWMDHASCERAIDAAAKQGKTLSCSDARAANRAAQAQ